MTMAVRLGLQPPLPPLSLADAAGPPWQAG